MAAQCIHGSNLLADGYEQAHAFTAYANWLIPGRLMVGRYPYVEPSRCRTREQGEQQLRALLEAGLTTFICLQACHLPLGCMRQCYTACAARWFAARSRRIGPGSAGRVKVS